jgi:hypothetical protein
MNKILNNLIVLAVLICSSGVTASAQLPGACWHWVGVYEGPGGGLAGAFDCIPNGDIGFVMNCKVWNTTCLPVAGPVETNLQGSCPK